MRILFFALILVFSSCDNSSSEPEILFEFNDRYLNNFSFPAEINTFIISNPIGFILVNGASDTINANYSLDKTVKVKERGLSDSEFDKIYLDYTQVKDTLFITINSPQNSKKYHKSNLSINIPYKMDVIIETPNEGTNISYLDSDLKITIDFYGLTVFNHSGSLSINSNDGDIVATLVIPKNGYCNVYSEGGDITVKIPFSTSANIFLKTIEGTLT